LQKLHVGNHGDFRNEKRRLRRRNLHEEEKLTAPGRGWRSCSEEYHNPGCSVGDFKEIRNDEPGVSESLLATEVTASS
jgi:hypothetical protein